MEEKAIDMAVTPKVEKEALKRKVLCLTAQERTELLEHIGRIKNGKV